VVIFAGNEDELCLGAMRASCSLWAGKLGAEGDPRERPEYQPTAGVRTGASEGNHGQTQPRMARQALREEDRPRMTRMWVRGRAWLSTACGGPGKAVGS